MSTRPGAGGTADPTTMVVRARLSALRADPFARSLMLITLGALLLRVVYVLVAKRDEPALGDAIYYSAQAQEVADGGWFMHPEHPREAADHPPLTALTLAPISLLIPNELLAQRLFQTLIGTATVVVIGFLARRLAGDTAGLVAAGIAAVYPNLWVNDALTMSESVSTLCIAGLLLAVVRFADEPSYRTAAWAGLVGGMAVLARAELALLLALAVTPVALLVRSAPLRRRVGWIAVTGGVALALLVPWSLYNAGRFDRPVLISTNDGLTLGGANCATDYDTSAVGLWHLDCLGPGVLTTDQQEDPSVVSARYRDQAFDYIGDNVRRLPRVMAIRIGRTWNLYDPAQMVHFTEPEGRELPVSWTGLFVYYALLPLAVAGAVVLRRRRRPVWPFIATAVTVTVTSALFYGHVRFRTPAEVALVVLAAAALTAWPAPASPGFVEADGRDRHEGDLGRDPVAGEAEGQGGGGGHDQDGAELGQQ
jgi:4-amino-4-deoxy-L-arabinose transferase-like glycosyltransferase